MVHSNRLFFCKPTAGFPGGRFCFFSLLAKSPKFPRQSPAHPLAGSQSGPNVHIDGDTGRFSPDFVGELRTPDLVVSVCQNFSQLAAGVQVQRPLPEMALEEKDAALEEALFLEKPEGTPQGS
ncbi:MAG: hypothetical protein EBS01_07715 [Verrucomicrobia bacterium]|nr:hypothetical protein [Verrucomicrobiota bacterium]